MKATVYRQRGTAEPQSGNPILIRHELVIPGLHYEERV